MNTYLQESRRSLRYLSILVMISVALLSACNSSTQAKIFTPLQADEDTAAIYVYRPGAMANAMYSPDLYVDDELRFPVRNGKYSRLRLAPGEHQLKLDAGDESYPQLEMTLQPGTTYYLRVTTSLKIEDSVSYTPYRRSYNMQEITEDQAMIDIRDCCATIDQKPDIEGSGNQDPQRESGVFSVDKTQNPFSH